MKISPQFFLCIALTGFISSCTGQTTPKTTYNSNAIIGGGCDGCELMFEGLPAKISHEARSPNWNGEGDKLLIQGKVYQSDGKTLAPNVLIYFWQTDHQGLYSNGEGKSRRHGSIRGWVKSNQQGEYLLYTRRPAPYPNQDIPAHIHLAVKEPAIQNEYYVDELVFTDDPLLTTTKRKAMENRGGNGILTFQNKGDMHVAQHQITLGLNIPNYPRTK